MTAVIIIGAGPAGLTLANLLRDQSVDCVVLERRTQGHIEHRQRAGGVDRSSIDLLEESGLAATLLANAPEAGAIEFRLDGSPYRLDTSAHTGGRRMRLCTQQTLVQHLLTRYLDGGGDIRFEVADVELHGTAGDRPAVSYKTPSGETVTLECDYVAGCDGDRGVSRSAIPAGAGQTATRDFGLGWLTVLADVPPSGPPVMGAGRYGFAAQLPRGPRASRYYLQCPPDDTPESWPDERIWAELRLRLGTADLPTGPITEKSVVPLRAVVHEPMSHGRLHLVGDAAHVIAPLGGKGMNLAIYDAFVLAPALTAAVRDGDAGPLKEYSDTCLRRVWDYQDQAAWLVDATHASPDDSATGRFHDRTARARLERLFRSPSTAQVLAEFIAG